MIPYTHTHAHANTHTHTHTHTHTQRERERERERERDREREREAPGKAVVSHTEPAASVPNAETELPYLPLSRTAFTSTFASITSPPPWSSFRLTAV